MPDYEITERTIETKVFSLFITDPDDEDGGGWSYKAQSDRETVSIEMMGRVRVKHLPTLIQLLETAQREDTNRMEDFGSVESGFYLYDTEEEFREALEEDDKLTVGMDGDDFWIANAASVDESQKSVSILTLMRAAGRYVALEIGHPTIAFHAYELEAITEFLKKFL